MLTILYCSLGQNSSVLEKKSKHFLCKLQRKWYFFSEGGVHSHSVYKIQEQVSIFYRNSAFVKILA